MNAALRALNRFGLGARPGEAARLTDPKGWLHEQVGADLGPATGARLATSEERTKAFDEFRLAQQTVRIDGDREPIEDAVRNLRGLTRGDRALVLAARVATDAPLAERMAAFWSNHLCVAANKQVVALLAGPYEYEAIRPHVFGRFEDMVLASARHPAMLLYLDNARSVGPNSRATRRRAADGSTRGLNENYARELLELHTLGVDGGYDQSDVRELAHVLTGWTVRGVGPLAAGQPIGFEFRRVLHDSEPRSVLGRRYAEPGERRGVAVIRDLCRHPSTAQHIATKLVRHFVSDEPHPSDVDRIKDVFVETSGDLAEVTRALIELDSAWDGTNAKFRSPQDWLVAALRALDVRDIGPRIAQVLTPLRQPLWAPPSPKGYGDERRDWADPDGLMNRAELARTLADRFAVGRTPPARLESVVEPDAHGSLSRLLKDDQIPASERVALALAGPAFQWR